MFATASMLWPRYRCDLFFTANYNMSGESFLWPYFFTFIFRKVPRICRSRARPSDINFAIIQKLSRVTLITLSNKYGDKIFASKLFPINVIVRLILPTFHDKKSLMPLGEESLKAPRRLSRCRSCSPFAIFTFSTRSSSSSLAITRIIKRIIF